jgi:hypothetical protein
LFYNRGKDDEAAIIRFAESNPPQEVLSVIIGEIHQRYLEANQNKQSPSTVADSIQNLLPAAKIARRRAGNEQRDIDLNTMRTFRYMGSLCVVLGAGVTMDAGGPSWEQLVRKLLSIGLETGFDIVKTIPPDQLGPSHILTDSAERVVGKKHFTKQQKPEAQEIISMIDDKRADTETLMRGAQLCLKVAGQRLFADITNILYDNGRRGPGLIHEELAALAEHIKILGPGDNRVFGWSSIITYNFDDLMGMALDNRGIARAAWAMRGKEPVGDPNDIAKRQGQNSPYLPVIHLHGYTPARFFYITNIKFVFATSQYETVYGADQRPILDSVFEQFLANPVQRALYVGCSFQDQHMNKLLKNALDRLPGCEHCALLQWPGPGGCIEATADEIERQSSHYLSFGIRPVWFDKFTEIPDLIRKLK